MRIIQAEEIKDKEIKKRCYKCLTKFAYTKDDTEMDRESKYVRCPVCKSFIAIA